MKTKFILLLLGLLLFSCHKQRDYNVHYFAQPVQESPLPIIYAVINGKPAYFLLDTGAGSSVIDINQADNYNIKYSEDDNNALNGIGGKTNIYVLDNIKSFTIDNKSYNINWKGGNLLFLSLSFRKEANVDILGILGSDFLEKYGFILDYSKNTITESKP